MRPMTMTDETQQALADKLREELEERIKKLRPTDKKLTLSFDLSGKGNKKPDKVPIVAFSYKAWLKMQTMVQRSSNELALHGLVNANTEDRSYYVYDMLCYPQKTAAATVEASDDYHTWLADLPEETLGKLRFQMHSHVNMSPSPSAVDIQYYEDMVTQIPDFFIFMILNKSGKLFINIYDKEHNVIYEDDDIEVDVVDKDDSLEEWVTTAMDMVETAPPPTKKYGKGTGYPISYDDTFYMEDYYSRYNIPNPGKYKKGGK